MKTESTEDIKTFICCNFLHCLLASSKGQSATPVYIKVSCDSGIPDLVRKKYFLRNDKNNLNDKNNNMEATQLSLV